MDAETFIHATVYADITAIFVAAVESWIGIVGLLVSVVGIVCIFLFWKSREQYKLAAFLLLMTGAIALGFAIFQELDEPTGNTALSFMPNDANVIIFNASAFPQAASRLRKYISENSTIESPHTLELWADQWIMDHTRIYYRGEGYHKVAEMLERELAGVQFLIDYDKQPRVQSYRIWPERDGVPFSITLEKDDKETERNLAIFVGNDVKDFDLNQRYEWRAAN